MRERPSRSAVVRYVLFQVPSAVLLAVVLLLLHSRLGLDREISWAIFLVWILKDAVLFPFVWRSYRTGDTSGEHGMVGLTGHSRAAWERQGKVEVRGEIWDAELIPGSSPVSAGSPVRVVSVRGMTLLVETVSPRRGEGPPSPLPRGRV